MLIYTHHPHSKGAKALSKELGVKLIRHHGSKFRGRGGPIVLNWGASELPEWHRHCRIINTPEAVNVASNKLRFFDAVKNKEIIPPYTIDRAEAEEWTAKTDVVCRTMLRASGGDGIVIAKKGHPEQLVQAPLYVKYRKKVNEWRVHVYDGEAIDVQRKARDRAVADEEVNWAIRNHDNGFIYMRGGIQVPPRVEKFALQAMGDTTLVFGAVDIIEGRDKVYVLEINTAPGLEGQTVHSYVEATKKYCHKL